VNVKERFKESEILSLSAPFSAHVEEVSQKPSSQSLLSVFLFLSSIKKKK